jgi:hypothetical protein
MTRILLSMLAVAEGALGMFGLVGAVNMFLSHAAGMGIQFLPVLAMALLLLVAGAAIFLRRPWSYYLHIITIVAVGVILGLNLGTLVGTATPVGLLLVVLVTAGITGGFFLPPVRRYFGV